METTYEQMSVPVSRLILDAETNVRKRYDKDSVKSMKASILEHGIIQPLAVRPPADGDADLGGQLYRAFAGGRRTRALTELLSEKQIGPDYLVPIIVRDIDDKAAAELLLAENIIRHDMQPADEFRAFKRLADDGLSAAEIALRFGQSERFVRGRLALGNVHADILAAFEDGLLSFESVAAYTVQTDPAIQVKVFNDLNTWQRNSPHAIKSVLRADGIPADSQLAEFIGEERYRSAGGVVQEDLFGQHNYWMNGPLVAELKAAKIEELRAEALADGWSFFQTTEDAGKDLWSFRVLSPEGNDLSDIEAERMTSIEEMLEEMEEGSEEHQKLSDEWDALDAKTNVFTAEQKARSGVVLDADRLQFRYGCLAHDGGSKTAGAASSGADSGSDKPARDPLALTAPVLEQLGKTATEAFAASVEKSPNLALALLAAQIELGNGHVTGRAKPSRIKVERQPGAYALTADKNRDYETTFKKYAKMDEKKLAAALAKLVAGTIDLTEAWLQSELVGDDRRAPFRRACFDAFGTNPTPLFDAQAFFDGSRKPVIEAAMQEMTGHGSSKVKKGDMATEAAETAVKTGWLPEGLRFKGYKLKKD